MKNISNFTKQLPNFTNIDVKKIAENLNQLLKNNKKAVEKILEQENFTWDNLQSPLEILAAKIDELWSPIRHLHGVQDSEALRQAYNECLPKLTEYSTEFGQNEKLFQAFEQIAQNKQFESYNLAQQKLINDTLRDFRLAGVALSHEDKKTFQQLQQQLTKLSSKFEENVLDATQAWQQLLTEQQQVAGIPPLAVKAAKQLAEQKQQQGWLFTLDFPSYHAIITYAEDGELRKRFYQAYSTRASDQGPNQGEFDNSDNMVEILQCRHQLAKLLDYQHYPELSLATKMAQSPEQVMAFLNDLAEHAKPFAQQDFQQLADYAKQHHNIEQLQPWDIAYYSEKLRQHQFAISQEDLRPYFPAGKVIEGLFTITNKLFGIRVELIEDTNVWDPHVQCYGIYDQQDELRGMFYMDLYTRPNKRGGAWMDECQTRYQQANGEMATPIAFIVCNLVPPSAEHDALFNHEEVITLFHEFGHGIHHMLTKVDYYDISGINGVAWDAVELPSQFLENWCWQKEGLDIISSHYQSGDKLPTELLDKMLAAKNFQAGMKMVRQLEFAMFDFQIHLAGEQVTQDTIQAILDTIRAQVSVVPIPAFHRFQHSFTHIFSGGYGAGYYSYLWAEVLSSDAFAKFEETGILNQDTGKQFLTNILEVGGSREAMDSFIAFRGREPQNEALLRHSGFIK